MKNLENERNVLKTQTRLLKSPTLGEEIDNSITHVIGAALSVTALVILVVLARNGEMPGEY
jgi:predicted membrane channel-forming protein YqfA (hemolysin III family)